MEVQQTRCPSCHHSNGRGRRFCARCGSSLGEICAACDAQNDPGANFCGTCGAALPASPTPRPKQTGAGALQPLPQGERRQLTVVFSDLVGSTAISQQLDPEEWRDVLTEYQRLTADAVARFGGHVAQHQGDGIVVYFGWPEARGDDAERAVRAGLALREGFAALQRRLVERLGVRLAVRVGMHTGPVVISDDGEVFGETANIAARVQSAAEPDTVVMTAATHELVSGLFLVDDLGAHVLKGVQQATALFRVVRPSGVRGRLAAAAAARALTPFVGRDDERPLLRSRFEEAREGEGQVVLLIGEPGIGKSRLAQVLHEDLAGTRHTWVESGGAPYFANTPFYAVS